MTSENEPREGEPGRPRRRRRRRKRRPESTDGTPSPAPSETPSSADVESEAPPKREERDSRPPRESRPSREPRSRRSSGRRSRGARSDAPRSRASDSERSESGRSESGRTEAPKAQRAGRALPRPNGEPCEDQTGFSIFGLPEALLCGLVTAGYETPTEIQARLLPLALEGQDVVARSRTGTGKTCAFIVPALASLDEVQISRDSDQHPRGPVRVLVVTPTRELAMQVAKESEKLARYVPVRTLPVYGGTQLKSQIQQIPHSAIVVGTPGRLLDHMGRRTLDTSQIEIVVLDEVDRMYDLGFRDDVDKIMRACANRRQTILVSATLNDDVERLIAKHMGRHERIEIESKTLTVDEVQQTFYVVEPNRKREMLAALLRHRNPERTIVFTRTRFTADRVAYVLQQEGFDAQEIHSGLPQRRREAILEAFRKGKLSLLIATDVAARGLDIQGVDHVINYDIPQAAEDYVHRVGRTARMGEEGWAVTFVTPDDGAYLTQVEKLINKEIKQERFQGFGPPAPAADAPDDASEEAPPAPKSKGIPRWSNPARKRR